MVLAFSKKNPQRKKIKNFWIFFVILVFLFPLSDLFPILPVDGALASLYSEKQGELVQRLTSRGLSENYLIRIFSDSRVELYPEIVERTGKGLNYLGRRFGLLTRKSVRQGKVLLQDNRILLRKIEDAYGVDREILVSILRIETNFGRVKGQRPVFNSLLTMTLIENRRSAWAEEELGHLLMFCLEEKKDPFLLNGSWAGAFGLPQFIPSSYVRYGRDGDADGVVDLNNLSDALASIANYLKAFGWSHKDVEKKKKALFAYNHCDQYVKAVLAYAQAIRPGSRH
jgi:membrane-bound lytic murein transglycosylase B